jgi:hypothetical protein
MTLGYAYRGTFAVNQSSSGTPQQPRSMSMKALVSMFALVLALAVTGPAFAGDVTKATDKASCDKAGGMWDDAAKKCSEKKTY